MRPKIVLRSVLCLTGCVVFAGCSDDDGPTEPEPLEPFTLSFEAIYEDAAVGCGDQIDGFGPTGAASIELSDLRFYVSNLRFFDEAGASLPLELDTNEFQLTNEFGSVALVDLTGTASGACAGNGLTFPEGTARTNSSIAGMTYPEKVHRVAFDVGMPQGMMKDAIANNTAEDAPSPLREMHWSWAFAYRHFVMNFTIQDDGVAGEGYIHVGSSDCGGDGTRALTDRDACGKPYSPAVDLHFHLEDEARIGVDLASLLDGVDFEVLQSDSSSVMVPGVATHSSPAQPDTEPIFQNFGLDLDTGTSNSGLNYVFRSM